MPIVQMLTSFQGRMRRRDYWLCAICLTIASWILNSVIGMAFAPAAMVPGAGHAALSLAALSAMSTGMLITCLLLLWPSIAIGVKRCHDRDKSGIWLLLVLIPFLGWLWALIELGLLDGTPGPNKYGPSPKGLGGTADPVLAN